MGYVITPDQQLHSVSWTDFQFYEWGDEGKPPQEMKISFGAGKLITCELLQENMAKTNSDISCLSMSFPLLIEDNFFGVFLLFQGDVYL